jgi:transcriptional regulator with XRE-family HTH domain
MSSRSFLKGKNLDFFIILSYSMDMPETIQDRIVKVRDTLGLTQKDFAKNIYVSQTYYSNVENATRPINDRIIALICSQYGVNKEFLLTGKGEMFSENLPDLQLHQLLEIFNELEKPFKEYIIQQVKQLAEALKNSKQEKSTPKDKKGL